MFIHTYPDFLYPGWTIAAFQSNNENHKKEIKQWCYNTYGHPGYEVGWMDMIVHGEVIFKRMADVELFLLRWQ
jgi:hypothetical protein